MNFATHLISLPPVPSLLADILLYQFSTIAYVLKVDPGKEVEVGKPLQEVRFRGGFFSKDRSIISPVSGLIFNSSGSCDKPEWCKILPYENESATLSGLTVFTDFCKGFWPLKQSVYRNAKPYLGFSNHEVENATESLLASKLSVIKLTSDDLKSVLELKAQCPQFTKGFDILERTLE